MLKNERQHEIMHILKHRRYATVEQLTKELFASASSIRRDLTELELRGLVKRSYGGAELSSHHSAVIPFSIRIDSDTAAKKVIAKKAAALIREGDTIFLDQSSSSSYLAQELAHIKGITVITNNINIVMYLGQYATNVICTGGRLLDANRIVLAGYDSERMLDSMHADWAAFSSRAITDDGKIYDCQYEESAVRQAMLRNADKKIFLCSANKVSTVSNYLQCTLAQIDYLVCEKDLSSKFKNSFPNVSFI